jgi:hypothetical protein
MPLKYCLFTVLLCTLVYINSEYGDLTLAPEKDATVELGFETNCLETNNNFIVLFREELMLLVLI